ncbi:MAG: hypothetical protein ACQESN_04220 [Thermotogota bacterium]
MIFNKLYSIFFLLSLFSSFVDSSNSSQNSYLSIVLYFLTQFIFITGIYVMYNDHLKENNLKNSISYPLILTVGFLLMIYFLKLNIYFWLFQNLLLVYVNYNSMQFAYDNKKNCFLNVINLKPYIKYEDNRSDKE